MEFPDSHPEFSWDIRSVGGNVSPFGGELRTFRRNFSNYVLIVRSLAGRCLGKGVSYRIKDLVL